MDELIGMFVQILQENGGPALDVKVVRNQFLVASVAQVSTLLDQSLIEALSNPRKDILRILRDDNALLETVAEDQLSRLVNVVMLLVREDAKLSADKVAMNSSFFLPVMDVWNSDPSALVRHQVVKPGFEVRERPEESSVLVCYLPFGIDVMVERKKLPAGTTDVLQPMVYIVFPIHGWVLAECLAEWPYKDVGAASIIGNYNFENQPLGEGVLPWNVIQSTQHLWAVFSHARSGFVENQSQGLCGLCSDWLRNALATVAENNLFIDATGNNFSPWNTWRVVDGQFCSGADSRPMPHSWVVCEDDGSIVDLTADQFGECFPQIWWPAEARFYLDKGVSKMADASVKNARAQFDPEPFTLEMALAMQEDLIDGYKQQSYQDAIRTAIRVSGADWGMRVSVFRDIKFKHVQAAVLEKYDFDKSNTGVQQSMQALASFNADPRVARNNSIMTYFCDPANQDVPIEQFVQERAAR